MLTTLTLIFTEVLLITALVLLVYQLYLVLLDFWKTSEASTFTRVCVVTIVVSLFGIMITKLLGCLLS